MKAWRIETHGGPEVLKRLEISQPTPKVMEVLVRVEAVGLNHLDVWVRKGVPGHQFPLPLTPGSDVAGVVAGFGSGAQDSLSKENIFQGTPVLVDPLISCRKCEACLSGNEPICRSFGIIGETQDGGCADFISVPANNIIKRPDSLSAVECAALPTNFVTAWSMLVRKAKITPGETVLIQAGGSAVSIAAIQIAKLLGCEVITTVGSDEKVAKAHALGADHVIPYRKTPLREGVKKILAARGKKGCEVVLDHTGAEFFQESLKCVAWGGRWVTCGATSGANVEVDLKAVFFKNISILGTTMGSRADLLRILDLASQRKLRPVVDSTSSMKDLPLAIAKLENRQSFGKVVVTQ